MNEYKTSGINTPGEIEGSITNDGNDLYMWIEGEWVRIEGLPKNNKNFIIDQRSMEYTVSILAENDRLRGIINLLEIISVFILLVQIIFMVSINSELLSIYESIYKLSLGVIIQAILVGFNTAVIILLIIINHKKKKS